MLLGTSLAATFRAQHGAATDRQIRAAGVSLRQQQALLASGVWVRPVRGVVTVAGSPATWHQRASVAVLGSGPAAALSHGSAARLHELDGYATYAVLHVVVPHGARPNAAGAIQHVLVGHRRADITAVDGIAVVTVPMAIIGCLATDGRERAGQALDSALRAGRPPEWFLQVGRRWRRQGRSGPSDLLDMIVERTDRRLPRSWFQRLAHRALVELGVQLVDEHPVHDERGQLLAELDLADVEHRIGIECQSWRWHASPAAQRADSLRKRALRRLGWEIVEVWWSDLDRLEDVVATVRAIRAERTAARQPPG